MDVNNNVNLQAGMYAFHKAKDVKENQVLAALGMTPQTQNAQKEIDDTIEKQNVAQAIGQGVNIDFKA